MCRNAVNGEHLMLALTDQSEGLFPRVLQHMEISVETFGERLAREPVKNCESANQAKSTSLND